MTSINAMKLALEALDCLIYDKPYAGRFADALIGLRTAIQQAEAQQPVAGEPVGYMNEGHIHELAMRRLPYGYVYPEAGAGASTAVYTHPAPSVPDDSKRLDYLQDRGATIDLIAGVADFYPMQFRVGGLHSSANIDVRAAIDAAMLAAK